MILLTGGSGYIGKYLSNRLDSKSISYISIDRSMIYNGAVYDIIKKEDGKGSILINAAGFTGKPNVDTCEDFKPECHYANVELPARLAEACADSKVIFGHISSGCIYTGDNEGRGFNEADEPNLSWKYNNCSYYSGTKAKCEELLSTIVAKYIWRIRMPFNSDIGTAALNDRNYISKLLKYKQLIDIPNSLSHIGQLVDAIIDSYNLGIEYGTYNITNPGAVKASDVMNICKWYNIIDYEPVYITEAELLGMVKAPRSNCILDSTKAIRAGLRLTDGLTMVEESVREWKQS